MTCTRCQGLMVPDHFMDFDGTIGHMWASGHRCMNCGNVHDAVIEQHRLARVRATPALTSNHLGNRRETTFEDVQPVVLQAA